MQSVIYSAASRYHPPHLAGTVASIIFCIRIGGAAAMDPVVGYFEAMMDYTLPDVLLVIMPASMIAIGIVALALPSPSASESDARSG